MGDINNKYDNKDIEKLLDRLVEIKYPRSMMTTSTGEKGEFKYPRIFDIMSRDGSIEQYWIFLTEDKLRDVMKAVLSNSPLRFSVYDPLTNIRQTISFEDDGERVILDTVSHKYYQHVTTMYAIG